jgi:hypothetical protein
VSGFGLGWCEVVAVFEGPAVVEPVDPFGVGDLEVVESLPGSPGLDQLGLVEPDHRLGQRVVIPGAHGQVLHAAVVVRDEPGEVLALALPSPGLLWVWLSFVYCV